MRVSIGTRDIACITFIWGMGIFEIKAKERAVAPETVCSMFMGSLCLSRILPIVLLAFAGAALGLSGGLDNTDDMIYYVSTYLESP